MDSNAALSADDQALLDRLAIRIVELRLELPAILTLESCKPLSLIAGQAMAFFEPLASAVFPIPDYRRFSALIERRETMETLLRTIEKHVDDRDARRKAAKDAPDSRGPEAATPAVPGAGQEPPPASAGRPR